MKQKMRFLFLIFLTFGLVASESNRNRGLGKGNLPIILAAGPSLRIAASTVLNMWIEDTRYSPRSNISAGKVFCAAGCALSLIAFQSWVGYRIGQEIEDVVEAIKSQKDQKKN